MLMAGATDADAAASRHGDGGRGRRETGLRPRDCSARHPGYRAAP